MTVHNRLTRLDAKLTARERSGRADSPEARRELAAMLADMTLRTVGAASLGAERVESAFPDSPSPFVGLPREAVIAAFLDGDDAGMRRLETMRREREATAPSDDALPSGRSES
ncbi:hypothetical protein RAS1_37890 [Phycisphaerae bacterium RAS1]|nr:hypothetical protein RAS1_37890 [Phycisphaerae bacterium RAS1]